MTNPAMKAATESLEAQPVTFNSQEVEKILTDVVLSSDEVGPEVIDKNCNRGYSKFKLMADQTAADRAYYLEVQ
jgi:hypothetical protein